MPKENPHFTRVSELLQAYKIIATREKSEKDRKKYPISKRRPFNFSSSNQSSSTPNVSSIATSSALNTDKYGILGPLNRRGKSASTQQLPEQTGTQSLEAQLALLLKPPTTVDTFEPLSEDYFTKPMNPSLSDHIINSQISLIRIKETNLITVLRVNESF